MSIKKTKLDYGLGEYYSFEISLIEGTFEIIFAGNLDLYWNYTCKYDEIAFTDSKEFLITKETGYLYELLKELYENIINYNVFSYSLKDNDTFKSEMKERDKYNPRKLCKDGIIDWHSDDNDYEDGARLLIEKKGDLFKITFVKGVVDKRPTFAIRICNSGTRYPFFNNCFMKMYNKLVSYDPSIDEYHQISIKEYMDDLKLTRKKESKD